MSRTELQYNLQKARALATELRATLDEIEAEIAGMERYADIYEAIGDQLSGHCSDVSDLETLLDDLTKQRSDLVGEGHVKLEIEPNAH